MYRAIIGDRNYLSLDYERDFIFKGVHYISLIDVINNNMCNTKSDLVELVGIRCLQHLDFFKYVLHLPADIVYRSEKYTNTIIGNGEITLDMINQAYNIFISRVYTLKQQVKDGYVTEPLVIPNAINVVAVIKDDLTKMDDMYQYIHTYDTTVDKHLIGFRL